MVKKNNQMKFYTLIVVVLCFMLCCSSAFAADNGISVRFSLLGDEMHGAPAGDVDTHTLSAGNLTVWIADKVYVVPAGATVLDVFEKALGENGMKWRNSGGNYIASITRDGVELAEMSNGRLSGWMYTLNGVYPFFGVKEQALSDGDVIVFHYTDDYTAEERGDQWNDSNETNEVKNDIKADIENPKEPEKNLSDNDNNEEMKAAGALRFNDVGEGSWYYEAVRFVHDAGLMQGETAANFNPDGKLNRAMLVTILYRLEGMPRVSADVKFTDVTAEAWYADAIVWAGANGIVNGYEDGDFAPMQNVSREETAVMLMRYAGYKQYDISGAAELSVYRDAADVSDWAAAALRWANAEGLINGDERNLLEPQGNATRAEAAAILMRVWQKLNG